MCTSGAKAFQAEGPASAKALGQERACRRRPVWLEQGEMVEDAASGAGGGGAGRSCPMVLLRPWQGRWVGSKERVSCE